jgi:hypothetical protein
LNNVFIINMLEGLRESLPYYLPFQNKKEIKRIV